MKNTKNIILAAFVAAACLVSAVPSHAAYSHSNLTRLSSGQDDNPQAFSYESTGETIATVIAANYFADANAAAVLEAGDLIYVTGSDGQALVTVTSISSSASVVARFSGTNQLQATSTYNPGSLADGAGETSSGITVTGAALGDFCQVAAPYDLQDITVSCYVQATDTVEIRVQNESGSTIDLASGSWKVRITK